MFKRQQASVLLSRISEPRRFIQVIAGARQVGKSTMVKQVVNELTIPYLLTTAEDAPDKNPQWIRYVWQQARQAMRLNNYPELKGMYKAGDGNNIVLYFKDAVATFYSFGDKPKEIKF